MKIIKPDFKNEKNYSSIPNAIFGLKDLNANQKLLLGFLLSHRNGFNINFNFLQKGLNLSNWITVKKHFNKLVELSYIILKNDEIHINLELINKTTNNISTNKMTTKKISTNNVSTNNVNNSTKNISSSTKKISSDSTKKISSKSTKKVSTNNINNNNNKQYELNKNTKQDFGYDLNEDLKKNINFQSPNLDNELIEIIKKEKLTNIKLRNFDIDNLNLDGYTIQNVCNYASELNKNQMNNDYIKKLKDNNELTLHSFFYYLCKYSTDEKLRDSYNYFNNNY